MTTMELDIDPRIMAIIGLAREAAFREHGPLTTDIVRATIILMEEVGEAAKDALALTRPVPMAAQSSILAARREQRAHLMGELSQVASIVINMMANLKMEIELDAKQP